MGRLEVLLGAGRFTRFEFCVRSQRTIRPKARQSALTATRNHRPIFRIRRFVMSKLVLGGPVLILSLVVLLTGVYSSTILALEDEIHAGTSLLASFQKLNGVAETPETKTIEDYLQKIGDKVAQNTKR